MEKTWEKTALIHWDVFMLLQMVWFRCQIHQTILYGLNTDLDEMKKGKKKGVAFKCLPCCQLKAGCCHLFRCTFIASHKGNSHLTYVIRKITHQKSDTAIRVLYGMLNWLWCHYTLVSDSYLTLYSLSHNIPLVLKWPCLWFSDTASAIFLVICLSPNVIYSIVLHLKYKNIMNMAEFTFPSIMWLEIDNADKPWAKSQELSLLEELNTLFKKHKFHSFYPIYLWHSGLIVLQVLNHTQECIFMICIPMWIIFSLFFHYKLGGI